MQDEEKRPHVKLEGGGMIVRVPAEPDSKPAPIENHDLLFYADLPSFPVKKTPLLHTLLAYALILLCLAAICAVAVTAPW